MNIDGVRGTISGAVDRTAPATADARLKGVCKDVEGVFLAMMMKEGLKSMIDGEEEGSSHAAAILETTVEQVANQMADTRSFGIANMLYEQVSGAGRTRKGNEP